jgi:hypothetical protein
VPAGLKLPSHKEMLKRLGAMLRDATTALGVTAILFALVNFAAAYALKQQRFPPFDPIESTVISPYSHEGEAILKRVFPGEDLPQLKQRVQGLPYVLHPSLEFAVPATDTAVTHIGIENIRYHDGWSDDEVKRRLASDRLTMILGGSTTFGHFVKNDETWPYYFDHLIRPGGEVSLNFGTIAYDQAREIDRLVYELRRGLRPRRVIFLDGLNDLWILASSNLRKGDRSYYETLMANRGEVAFSDGLRLGQRNWWRVLTEGLPAVKWLEQRLEPERSGDQIVYQRDVFTQGFDFREAEWARFFWYKWALQHAAQMRTDLVAQYETNLDFIDRLAKSYGFEALVFYQPIGLFDPANEFVTEAARQTPEYAFLASLNDTVRAEIASGRLNMIDLHDALDPLEHLRYVDTGHYSPAAHRLLAAAIFAHLKPLDPK